MARGLPAPALASWRPTYRPRSGALRRRRGTLLTPAVAAVVAAGTVALALAPVPAAAQTDPVAEAEAAMAAARAEADRAADAYLDVLTLAQTLDAELAATEQELEDLEAQAARLRARLQERAAQAYVRSGSTDLEFGLDSDEAALETARRSTLLNRLNESDNEVAEKLAGVSDSLEDRRAQLRADRAAHEDTLARLRDEQAAVDAKLAAAQAAYNGAVAARAAAAEAAASAAAEEAAAEAEPAPSSAPVPSTSSPAPRQPSPPVDYSPTPGEHPRHWDPFLVCTRQIESGGNYQAYNASGPYYGAYQFLQSTWNSAANHAGRPELIGLDPRRASEYDQDDMAWTLYQWQGKGPWNGRC